MEENKKSQDFIRDIVAADLKSGKHGGNIVTRFPPEPNGYLHIGHAKSICLNFGIAFENKGVCHLRFDDTNPSKEEVEYVDSIMEDIKWLGFDWKDKLFYASDYFERLFEYAVELIGKGKAYVCSLDSEQIRQYRGTLTEPGKESPYRNRTVEENMELFMKMKTGDFKEGEHVLRAKIDMASPNLNMRDPALYRIKHEKHHRTSDKWCIYPMYDFAHCLSDSIEDITHSICTLEFEDHRPLYDWILDELQTQSHPQQIEFARLNITYTVMSKRRLLTMVEEGHVEGWDDPRMPTLSGLRRRGYTPEAIRDFCDRIGVAKSNSTVDIALLEHCLREDLNNRAQRVMAVLDPIKVVIVNYPEGKTEELPAQNNPEDPSMGSRNIPFSAELYIERDDFMEDPPKKYFRLAPGREVRLKHAYYIKCLEALKDEKGRVVELSCTYDPDSKGGWTDDGRKVRGTLHWVSSCHAVDAEVRMYRNLFINEDPSEAEPGNDFISNINPDSLEVLKGCKVEPSLGNIDPGCYCQFLRKGYFTADKASEPGKPVFNRSVPLKDTWAKISRSKNKS